MSEPTVSYLHMTTGPVVQILIPADAARSISEEINQLDHDNCGCVTIGTRLSWLRELLNV